MTILALDTAAGAASCAVVRDGHILAEGFVNTKQTHSQTLMPMVEHALQQAECTMATIDGIALTVGPGSFTGVRIGVAAAKGLAFPHNTPCVAVSTLHAMADNLAGTVGDYTVCAVMDARCRQVYTATFTVRDGAVSRLSADEAVSIDDLKARLSAIDEPILLVGDGAHLCLKEFGSQLPHVRIASEHVLYPRASRIAAVAADAFARGDTVTAEELLPAYLRLPQAQRELMARNAQ